MDANRFTGLGFVASWWNADPNTIAPLGVVDSLALQITWGMGPSRDQNGQPITDAQITDFVHRCNAHGLGVIPWGWCDARNEDAALDEGRYHAERVLEIGFRDEWIANMEDPYEAGGDSNSPKYHMPQAYMEGFNEVAGNAFKALGVTTTPFHSSEQWPLANAGWVTMPQAFTGVYAPATVAACVAHMEAWGWPRSQIRPLVQVYEPRPAVQPYLADSAACGVGVVPYIVEQAMDTPGVQMLTSLRPATFRPPSGTPAPIPPDGDDMQKIGSQDGVTASCNRLRDMDPAGTLLRKDSKGKWEDLSALDATPMDKWKAYDKLERALTILVEDHDEMANA